MISIITATVSDLYIYKKFVTSVDLFGEPISKIRFS